MYTLTLTWADREAINFVGKRYSNGYNLYYNLWVDCVTKPDDVDWDGEGAITFLVPENVAWAIVEDAREEDAPWPLFSPDLAQKMIEFCNSVV